MQCNAKYNFQNAFKVQALRFKVHEIVSLLCLAQVMSGEVCMFVPTVFSYLKYR